MTQMQVHAAVSEADMQAALQFIGKRVRRRADALEGMTAALYSVMFMTGDGLLECGIPMSGVEGMFDQFKTQVVAALKVNRSTPSS